MTPAALEQAPRPGRGLVLLCTLATFVIAALGYAWTGTPDGIGAAKRSHPAAAPADARSQFAGMVQQLADRMKTAPEPEGLALLGRSYAVLGQTDDAVAAYRQALQMRADDPGILADLADLLATRNEGKLEGEPAQLVQRALAANPEHLKALGLAAMVAWQRGDRATAGKHWKRMVALGPADNPMVQGAQDGLNLLAGGASAAAAPGAAAAHPPAAASPPARVAAGAAPAATGASPSPAAAGTASVSGRVSLAPALRAQVSADDTVFVFARAAQGPRLPLAVLRRQVRDLPLDFTLDDSQAMSPAARLSGATQVVVGARISKSGNPVAQPGDLEGLSAPVAVGAKGLAIEIVGAVK
jgi:cytochrome c-type biogenesis protein CcmH